MEHIEQRVALITAGANERALALDVTVEQASVRAVEELLRLSGKVTDSSNSPRWVLASPASSCNRPTGAGAPAS